jgi:hypothetical protein
MNTRDFLQLLTPRSGAIFIATPSAQGGWVNIPHRSLDKAVDLVNQLTFENRPAYFSMAGYDKDKYFDDAAQKWRRRTQANARAIRSFFLDLDVKPGDPLCFDSKDQACQSLKAFVKKVGLPRPLIVDSGGGIHAYWPLVQDVTTAEWKPIAEQFKAICVHEQFNADRSLTSDEARVLRVLGSYNVKRSAPVSLMVPPPPPIAFEDFAQRITGYAGLHGVATTAGRSKVGTLGSGPAVDVWGAGDNLGATNDPLNFDRIVFHCPQLQAQAGARGRDSGEQLWRAGLGIVKFCEQQAAAARVISDGHPDFDAQRTEQKIINWNAGPTKCTHFHQLNPSTCESCPHWGKLTSPAQLGRQIIDTPAPPMQITVPPAPDAIDQTPVTITLTRPEFPTGYSRRADGAVVREHEDQDGKPTFETICPYDLYPLAIRSQNGTDTEIDEHSMWRAHLPLKRGAGTEPRDFAVPLGLLADQRGLSKLLFSKGVVLSGDQPKFTQLYMSAYLQKLAKEAGRDQLYERLGWHDGHETFVLGDRVIHRDGTSTPHTASDAIRATTKNGLKTAGTLAGWQQAMQFFNRPGYEGHRFFLYASFGSPLFHMNDTGNKGAMLAAGGASGRGKTTCLKACSSVWGSPEALVVNGNREGATTNALYSTLGTVHSLPFLLDDITERDSDELRRLALNISQGEGKRRMQADGTMVGRLDTWANLTLTSTNADTLTSLMSTGKDVDPHLMRVVSVEFALVDARADAKIEADRFIRAMGQNYGHAGALFMRYIAQHYEQVRKLYIRNVEKVDRLLASRNASAERYWSAVVAAAYTAAQIASKAGILDFPFEDDLKWMIALLTRQRESIREAGSTPVELLTQFLDGHVRNTLALSPKGATNLDNIVIKPFDELMIRHELDTDTIYVSRTAVMAYCAEHRTSFRVFEANLERDGVLAKRNAQKVLGADTVYSKGQTRCWMISGATLRSTTGI